jgi:hypothetical protein
MLLILRACPDYSGRWGTSFPPIYQDSRIHKARTPINSLLRIQRLFSDLYNFISDIYQGRWFLIQGPF